MISGAEARALIGGLPWPLIPAKDDDQGKRCIAKWKHLQGVAASTEYDDWRAELWAVPAGAGTGVVVLDFDGEDGMSTLANLDTLLAADGKGGCRPHVRTGSGGAHVYVKHPGWPVKTCTRALAGMDVRGDGGVAYVAGASRKGEYVVLRPRLVPYYVAELPPAFAAALRPHEKNARPSAPAATYDGRLRIGSQAFVEREVEAVRRATAGNRNSVFNQAVYTVAGIAAAGEVDPEWARAALVGAAAVMAPGWDPSGVLDSAWAAGAAAPWRIGPGIIGNG